ncbi:hypothetical protein UlMin_037351 [Ulmus minor]
MSGAGKVVCVTGASGFVASWLVKLLLEHGYTVKASVRNPNDQNKTRHLLSLDGAKERLHLFKANLLEEGSFDSVVDGCDSVFHTASPVIFSEDIPQAELVEPAVKGTLNVLRSSARVSTVKRVVITSSTASILLTGHPLIQDVVADETWFSDPVLCEKLKYWYVLSKTSAEEAAWKLAKENEIDLVTLHPRVVLGPLLQPTLHETGEMFLNQITNGVQTSIIAGYVDVRDVAFAHIQAFEVASASGRYCLVGHDVNIVEAVKILREIYPSLSIPKTCEEDKPELKLCVKTSKEKAKSLGINFTPLEVRTMSGAGKVVCVTGASGFVASWLVKLLLEHGYTVKASVRNPNDQNKTRHLLSLDGAKERLHLFKANLLEEGSFDSVVDGCDGVFHTASPVIFSEDIPQAELVEPAVKGTLNVLRSSARVSTVKRVVITSSTASILLTGAPLIQDVVADETWFSDPVFCEKSKHWYALSKTLAEEAAWRFAKENEIDLVTLHPGFVLGPLLQPTLHETGEMFLNQITNGVQTSIITGYVDVRDVAFAHIQAFEVASASGRYCFVGHDVSIVEAVKILREICPSLSIPKTCEEDKPELKLCFKTSKEKAKSLGINFTPLEVSLRDTVESLREKGFLKS